MGYGPKKQSFVLNYGFLQCDSEMIRCVCYHYCIDLFVSSLLSIKSDADIAMAKPI